MRSSAYRCRQALRDRKKIKLGQFQFVYEVFCRAICRIIEGVLGVADLLIRNVLAGQAWHNNKEQNHDVQT